MSKKTEKKAEINPSILTEKDLKKIKLTINDGKDTTCYLKFTNDLEDDPKKKIYLMKIINSHGRKQGLEIYQTTHGGECVFVMLKPIVEINKKTKQVFEWLEIEVGCDMFSFMKTTIPNISVGIDFETKTFEDEKNGKSDNKELLIELIKSMIKYSADYIGNPTYIK
jgi:hypothetical protein